MSSQGPSLAGSGVDDASVGSLTWLNPTNITAADSTFASVGSAPANSHYLKSSSHGFSIPTGATILGIFAEVLVKWSGAGSATDFSVKAAKGGAASGTEHATGTSISSTLTWIGYGNSTDLWGLTWTDTDINAAGFGLAYAATLAGVTDSVSVDATRITVYYSLGDADLPADNKSALSQPSPSSQARRLLGVQHLGGTPGPDSDDDANIINSRVAFWNP